MEQEQGTHGDDPSSASIPTVADLLHRPEPLDPELEARLERGPTGMCIRHPLVHSVFHVEAFNALANSHLRHKRSALEHAIRAEDWHDVVFLHERPWRAEALLEHAHLIPDQEYWDLVARVWTDSENIREVPQVWECLLGSRRPGRESLMSDEERDALADLPERISVWQGHTDGRDDGWSWTTDRSTAEWFARRFSLLEGGIPMLSSGTVRRDDVLAYLLGRGEFEILVDRGSVEAVKTSLVGA